MQYFLNGGNYIAQPGSNQYFGSAGIEALLLPGTPLQYAAVTKTGPLSGTFVFAGPQSTFAGVEYLNFFDGELSFDPGGVQSAVYRLYDTVFDRAPDQPGFQTWSTLLGTQLSLRGEAQLFLASPEGQAEFAGLGTAGVVQALYQNALGRTPSPAEVAGWLGYLQQPGVGPADVVVAISESPEHVAVTFNTVTQGLWYNDLEVSYVATAYALALGRDPDLGGAIGWANYLYAGGSLQGLAAGFAASPEFAAVNGALSNAAFVTALYEDGLGRDPSPGELAGWEGRFATGASRAAVLYEFLAAPEALNHTFSESTYGITFA